MKVPKKLYEYERHSLQKISIKLGGMMEVVVTEPFGTRWRYRGEGFDQYGWDSQNAAKQAAIADSRRTIAEEQLFLKKMEAV